MKIVIILYLYWYLISSWNLIWLFCLEWWACWGCLCICLCICICILSPDETLLDCIYQEGWGCWGCPCWTWCALLSSLQASLAPYSWLNLFFFLTKPVNTKIATTSMHFLILGFRFRWWSLTKGEHDSNNVWTINWSTPVPISIDFWIWYLYSFDLKTHIRKICNSSPHLIEAACVQELLKGEGYWIT